MRGITWAVSIYSGRAGRRIHRGGTMIRSGGVGRRAGGTRHSAAQCHAHSAPRACVRCRGAFWDVTSPVLGRQRALSGGRGTEPVPWPRTAAPRTPARPHAPRSNSRAPPSPSSVGGPGKGRGRVRVGEGGAPATTTTTHPPHAAAGPPRPRPRARGVGRGGGLPPLSGAAAAARVRRGVCACVWRGAVRCVRVR